jgi:hypothetical protein
VALVTFFGKPEIRHLHRFAVHGERWPTCAGLAFFDGVPLPEPTCREETMRRIDCHMHFWTLAMEPYNDISRCKITKEVDK